MKARKSLHARRAKGTQSKGLKKKGLFVALVLFVFLCIVGSAGAVTPQDASPNSQPAQVSQEVTPTHTGTLALTASGDQSFDATGSRAWATVTKEGGGAQTIEVSFSNDTAKNLETGTYTVTPASHYLLAADGTLIESTSRTSVTIDNEASARAEVSYSASDLSAMSDADIDAAIESAASFMSKHMDASEVASLKAAALAKKPTPQPAGTLKAHFIDVGQGDSEFIELPDGKSLLIDGGPTDAGGKVLSYIKDLGYSRIDYVVATHPHEDHIGGLTTVISSLEVGEIWAPDASTNTRTFENFLDAIESRGIETHGAAAGKTIGDSDAYSIQVLGPQSGASFDDLNDASAIVLVTFGQNTFLFTGDASSGLISQACNSHVDVLKVGHHGSKTSTNASLVAGLSPTYAVISYGIGNSYGHPTQEALDALSGTTVYGTGANGTVTIESDGTNLSISTEKDGAVVTGDTAATSAFSAAAATESPGAQADTGNGSDPTVYVTKTGKKYHRDGCQYLKKSKIPMSLSEAKSAGLEPCSKCHPPT